MSQFDYINIFTDARVEIVACETDLDEKGKKKYYVRYRKQKATPAQKTSRGAVTDMGQRMFRKPRHIFEACYMKCE